MRWVCLFAWLICFFMFLFIVPKQEKQRGCLTAKCCPPGSFVCFRMSLSLVLPVIPSLYFLFQSKHFTLPLRRLNRRVFSFTVVQWHIWLIIKCWEEIDMLGGKSSSTSSMYFHQRMVFCDLHSAALFFPKQGMMLWPSQGVGPLIREIPDSSWKCLTF